MSKYHTHIDLIEHKVLNTKKLLYTYTFSTVTENTMLAYLSLGTNIDPEQNAVRMIENLCQYFGEIRLYPFVYTKSIDMALPSTFLNALVILNTSLNKAELKTILNTLETKLGRDRQDPLCSVKDRPADMDILAMSDIHDESFFKIANEPYIHDCLDATRKKADLSKFGLPTHQGAATVYWDGATSKIIILEDKL